MERETVRGRGIVVLLVDLAARSAVGQRVEPKRGKTILVGTPPGPSPTDRVPRRAVRRVARAPPHRDASRRVATQHRTADRGCTARSRARGDVTVLTARGESDSCWRRTARSYRTPWSGPRRPVPDVLSDGTAAFLTTANDVVGVRLGGPGSGRTWGAGDSSVSPLSSRTAGSWSRRSRSWSRSTQRERARARRGHPEDELVQAIVGIPGTGFRPCTR